MNAFFTDAVIEIAAKIVNTIAPQLPQLFTAAPALCCNESQIQDDAELEWMFAEWLKENPDAQTFDDNQWVATEQYANDASEWCETYHANNSNVASMTKPGYWGTDDLFTDEGIEEQHLLEQYKAGLAAGRAGEPCPDPDETTQQWFWGYTQGQDDAEQSRMTDDYFASEKAASRAAGYQDGLADHYEPTYSEWAVPHYNEGWIAAHNDMARTEAALDEILAVGAFSLAMHESQKTTEGAYYNGLHGYANKSMTDPDLLAHYEIGMQRRAKFAAYPTLRPFLFTGSEVRTNVQCSDCGQFVHANSIDANGRCGECFAAAFDKDGDDAFPF